MATERAPLMIDRKAAAEAFPGTKRFVCSRCRFVTNSEERAAEHRHGRRRGQ